MKRILTICLILILPIFLFGCKPCTKYTKVKSVTPVKVMFHTEYLIEYEDGSYDQQNSGIITDKCIEY